MTTRAKHKPNTKLPKGARLLPQPVRKKVAGWTEMEYDAEVERLGLTWLRVRGGMGGREDREDWVAKTPALCISVHDYHWNGDDFGPDYGTFDNAIIEQVKRSRVIAAADLKKLRDNIRDLEKTITTLDEMIESARREGQA